MTTKINGNPTDQEPQYIFNSSFDKQTGLQMFEQADVDNQGNPPYRVSDNGALIVDTTTTANTIYIGKAGVGTATSAAGWQVKKIDTTNGAAITWGSGSTGFNQVWDNRAGLSYS